MPRRTQDASIRKWSARCIRMFRRQPREPAAICTTGTDAKRDMSSSKPATTMTYLSVIPAFAGMTDKYVIVVAGFEDDMSRFASVPVVQIAAGSRGCRRNIRMQRALHFLIEASCVRLGIFL